MAKPRTFIAMLALAGAFLGGIVGVLAAPKPTHFSATATVVMSPDATKTGGEMSAFWSVLNRGQMTRQAAILFQDPRWIPDVAAAADVPDEDVTLQSYVLADTMVLKVTVITTSPAADAALNELLITAAPAVEALVQPFAVEVLWPLPNSAKTVPVPPKSQLGAAGILWGGLAAFVVGAAYGRWNRHTSKHSAAAIIARSGR